MTTTKMKILVTGGAGYIGSYVCRELLDKGHEVIVVDNFSSSSRANVDHRCKLYDTSEMGTILKLYALNKAVEYILFLIDRDVDVVIHLAAYSSVGEGEKNPYEFYKNNVVESLELARLASIAKVKKFIFASSAAVYGEDQEVGPANVYGHTKLMTEEMMKSFAKTSETEFIALRLFNVAGALAQMPLKLKNPGFVGLASMYAAMLEKPILIDSYESQFETRAFPLRSYIHVGDVARAFRFAAEMKPLEKFRNRFFEADISGGRAQTNKAVIEALEMLMQQDIKVEYREILPETLCRSESRFPNSFEQQCGWRPTIWSLFEIVGSEFCHWVRASGKQIPENAVGLERALEKSLQLTQNPHNTPQKLPEIQLGDNPS